MVVGAKQRGGRVRRREPKKITASQIKNGKTWSQLGKSEYRMELSLMQRGVKE